MKILLIQPPIQDFYDTDIRLQPIGLAYLKAAVRKHLPDIQVVIRDFHHGWGRRTIPVPRELAYLREYYSAPDKSPFSTFFHYYHFGADFETIAEEIAAEKADFVGISSLFSPYYREALRVAEIVKKVSPAPVMLGGSHVSAMPGQMLSHSCVDFVITGEGEKAFVEFLKAWNSGTGWEKIPGLGFKQGGRVVLNEPGENFPIEEIPAPDLSGFAPVDYTFEKKPMSFVITSRSCPHRCTFCSVHKTFGFSYRRRSVGHVLNEIRSRYKDGIRVFDFEDDNLTFYKDEMKELCRLLIAEFPDKDVQFVAMNGISYLSLDDEMLALMRAAGFTHLNLALVTSDLVVRETTKRPHTLKKYLEVVSRASELGFKIVSYQILGLPSESLESMIQTLAFGAEQPVLLGASMFYLTPNSPIAKDFPAASETDVFLSRLTAMAIETPGFSRQDIYTLFVTTRILDFLKGLSFSAAEITLAHALELARLADARTAAGAEILDGLLTGRGHRAWTGNGFVPLGQFKTELFLKVWSRLRWIGTQQGRRILIQPNNSEILNHADAEIFSPAIRSGT